MDAMMSRYLKQKDQRFCYTYIYVLAYPPDWETNQLSSFNSTKRLGQSRDLMRAS